jgi:hypothetical protein
MYMWSWKRELQTQGSTSEKKNQWYNNNNNDDHDDDDNDDSGLLKIRDNESEDARNFKYLGTAINNTNDETEEIKARNLAAKKANSSLQTILRSKQIHQNNNIRFYKTLIKPVLLWKCNLDLNTNDRANEMYIWQENVRPIYRIYRIKDNGILDGIVIFIIYAMI